MMLWPEIVPGYEYPAQDIVIERAKQTRKLDCCGIDPDLYGDTVDVVMLGLPTLQAMMAAGISILGGVHLTQRFRQIAPIRFDEPVVLCGRVLSRTPAPRGSILESAFTYARHDGTVLVEAVRSGIIPDNNTGPAPAGPNPDESLDEFETIMQRTLEPAKVAAYSDEAGNLIHSDPEVARQHGFRAPIAAGLMGLHYYREALEKRHHCKAFDLEVRFRRPMFWDDTLTLVARETDGRIGAMRLLGSDGKPTSLATVHLVGSGG